MPFAIKKSDKLNVEEINKDSIRQLQDINEVNNQIIADSHSAIESDLKTQLDAGEIDQALYEEQLQQNRIELDSRLASTIQVEQKIARYGELNNENKGWFFLVPATITIEELSTLILVIDAKLTSLSLDNQKEKLCLEAIMSTVQACKNLKKEGRAFEDRRIPMLEAELNYIHDLKVPLAGIGKKLPHYLFISSQLDQIAAIKNDCNADRTISKTEKKIFGQTCDLLNKEIKKVLVALILPENTELTTEQEGAILMGHQDNLEKIMATYTSKTSDNEFIVLFGLKGFINKLCEVLNCKPLFKIESSVLADKFAGRKGTLSTIKESAGKGTELEDPKPSPSM